MERALVRGPDVTYRRRCDAWKPGIGLQQKATTSRPSGTTGSSITSSLEKMLAREELCLHTTNLPGTRSVARACPDQRLDQRRVRGEGRALRPCQSATSTVE
jgi:hypothetical protein